MQRQELLGLIEKEFGHGCAAICKERVRQIEVKNYDLDRDKHFFQNEELAQASVSYALNHKTFKGTKIAMWPWDKEYYNPTPKDRKKEFGKAGALLAAQIDVEHSKE